MTSSEIYIITNAAYAMYNLGENFCRGKQIQKYYDNYLHFK